MRFTTVATTLLAFALLSADAARARNEPLEPTPPELEAMPVQPVARGNSAVAKIAMASQKKDVFRPIAADELVVTDIVDQFMAVYALEMSRSSLAINVSDIIKAERTDVRGEMMEKEVEIGGLGIDSVEETQSQQYRIFLLMKYQFESTMLGHNRPYVTIMRLTMDCYNTSSDAIDTATEEQAEYDDAAAADVRLVCDVLEHVDMPRRNESTKSIPSYIQRQIYHSAPASYVHNHSLHVFFDAFEAQDLAFDAHGKAIADRDTMHYVRFRVQGGSTTDCAIAIEHTSGVNTLRYQDTACYDEAEADAIAAAAVAAAEGSRFALSKENAPVFVLIASVVGACVATLLLWRQRRRQRSGYSYLHSNTSKLSHVPAQQTGTTNTDAAVAC